MQFEFSDQYDKRIVETPRNALSYPSEVGLAPDNAGVYIFLDYAGDVIYVGKASGGRLKDEIKAKWNTSWDRGATKYRWFRTNSDEIAISLEAEWIYRYKPRNNDKGK